MRKKIILLILWTVFYLPSNLVHTQSAAQIQLLPIGFGEVVSLSSQQICIPPEEYDSILEKLDSRQRSHSKIQSVLFPLFDWPLENALHDGLILVNYVDLDKGVGIISALSLMNASWFLLRSWLVIPA